MLQVPSICMLHVPLNEKAWYKKAWPGKIKHMRVHSKKNSGGISKAL